MPTNLKSGGSTETESSDDGAQWEKTFIGRREKQKRREHGEGNLYSGGNRGKGGGGRKGVSCATCGAGNKKTVHALLMHKRGGEGRKKREKFSELGRKNKVPGE